MTISNICVGVVVFLCIMVGIKGRMTMNHDLIIAVILTFVGFILGKLIIYLVG